MSFPEPAPTARALSVLAADLAQAVRAHPPTGAVAATRRRHLAPRPAPADTLVPATAVVRALEPLLQTLEAWETILGAIDAAPVDGRTLALARSERADYCARTEKARAHVWDQRTRAAHQAGMPAHLWAWLLHGHLLLERQGDGTLLIARTAPVEPTPGAARALHDALEDYMDPCGQP